MHQLIGEDVRIWEDLWVPRGSTRRPITPRRGPLLTRVADLLHPNTGRWDEELVRDLFWPEPAILSLPTHMEMPDVVAWHYDPKGLFTVKSAYKLWCDDQQRRSIRETGEASSRKAGDDDKVWSAIWKLEGPNRLKHFTWRLAHNSLALRFNFERRGMKLDTWCVMCNRLGEDGCHLFFKCKYVRELWRCAVLENWREKLAVCGTAKEVARMILEIQDDNSLKILFLLCNWWQERNAVREGEPKRLPAYVASLSSNQALEVKSLNKPHAA